MQLEACEFNEFLDDIGQQVQWRRSHNCPCKNPHSGASSPSCGYCSGKGRFWDSPVESIVGISGQNVQRAWAKFGVWENGDVVITIGSNQPAYQMGQFDRTVLRNSTDFFSIAYKRGANDLLQFPVAQVSRVFWIAAGNIVEGGIPAVSHAGVMTWTADAPPVGTQYTVEGTRYPEYFCYGPFPSDRNAHSGVPLPRKVVLRKFDLFGR